MLLSCNTQMSAFELPHGGTKEFPHVLYERHRGITFNLHDYDCRAEPASPFNRHESSGLVTGIQYNMSAVYISSEEPAQTCFDTLYSIFES